MNLQDTRIVAAAAEEIENAVNHPKTLCQHTGSLGETAETLRISVMGKTSFMGDGQVCLYEGMPPCLGHDSRSNYAYVEPLVVEPTQSIAEWVNATYPLAKYFEMNHRTTKDWEGSTREEVGVTAKFFLNSSVVGVTEFTKTTVREDDRAVYTEVITGGDDCEYSYNVDYKDQD